MANQIAVQLRCGAGDQIAVGEHAHVVLYESGAMGAAGAQHVVLGRGGFFGPDDLEALRGGAYWEPRTRLVALENTHNRAGGRVWRPEISLAICERAHELGLATHLDGARLWNAAIATGASESTLARGFDTVSVCFSKGLGAPVGSAIVGSHEAMREALRIRKRMGGAMRQAGILAAAALHAIAHHRTRLADDHAHAARLASALADAGLVTVPPETNIVLFEPRRGSSPLEACERAKREGILVSPFGATQIRAVTHLDVDAQGISRAIDVLSR
jgi:threonine aldolase